MPRPLANPLSYLLVGGLISAMVATGPADPDRSVPSASSDVAAEAACQHPWVAPVDAAVSDPFRPPDHRFGPGNRGLEYATEPGQPVVAVDRGVVTFSGPVAGHPVVVVDHGAGLRSSYVHLVEVSAGRGDLVERGQPVATADAGFHLGARRGERYVDPSGLIERGCVIIRLVPV